MATDQSVPDDPCAGDDRVADVIAALLRGAAAGGQDDVALEGLTGVNRHTIKAYRLKTRRPSLAAGLSIVAVLGDRAVNALLHLIRYQGRPLDDADEEAPMQIVAGAMKSLSVIADAAADGRIDHTERPATTEAADQLIATIVPLSSAGKRG